MGDERDCPCGPGTDVCGGCGKPRGSGHTHIFWGEDVCDDGAGVFQGARNAKAPAETIPGGGEEQTD